MTNKHKKIEMEVAAINCEIEQLEALLSTISDIRMKANIRSRIYALEKERYVLMRILNF